MANYEAKFNKNGNIKVGKIWTWNKLAGSGVIAGCKGTCGKHCTGCYKADNPKNRLAMCSKPMSFMDGIRAPLWLLMFAIPMQ